MLENYNKITLRNTDFSQWYLDIIREADLADESPVRGCMVIKPYGYSIWENIKDFLDLEFKRTGVENAYFPLLIPKSFLEREAEHVEGFAKECAVVTHHRLSEQNGKLIPSGLLEEPYIIRPTSETIIYDSFSKWIQSYRDLPLLINQWANVMRWEMRTKPFLRTSEFLWQEGHTAHSTKSEADQKTIEMLRIYKKLLTEKLAISVYEGRKTESEKFAGADYTTTLEAMMQDGKALQTCTSHMLGQNFSKSFDVSFLNDKKEKEYAWQTSWGLSTRVIGAIIMSHSDDSGLVLPPNIAPIQVVIIPIYGNKEDENLVMSKVQKISNLLESGNVRVKVDNREGRPGYKYFEWERKGVPLRIEVGPKDVAKNSVVAVDRLLKNKDYVSDELLLNYVTDKLDFIQSELFNNSEKFKIDNTYKVSTLSEFKEIMKNKKGFVLANFCLEKECEEKIKLETGASSRCIPSDIELQGGGECIFCGKYSESKVLFGKAY